MFRHPQTGRVSFDQIVEKIKEFVLSKPDQKYRLAVGTDSQLRKDTWFVTAIVIHRVGNGASYFYERTKYRRIDSLRQRIMYETSYSLGVASKLAEALHDVDVDIDIEVHADVGANGPTSELIKDVTGMIAANGFTAKTKPDSMAASSVADKHTKNCK